MSFVGKVAFAAEEAAVVVAKKRHNNYRTCLWELPKWGKIYGILGKIVVSGVEEVAGGEVGNTPLNEASQAQHHIPPA